MSSSAARVLSSAAAIVLLVGCALTLFPAVAHGGCHPAAKIGAHLQPLGTWSKIAVCGTDAPETFGCNEGTGSNMVVHGNVGTSYSLYLVALDLTPGYGLQGAALSIEYDAAPGSGMDVFGFLSCADTAIPQNGWPASGGGIELEFANCQGTSPDPDELFQSSVVLGALYVYAYDSDQMKITSRAYLGENYPFVVDCEDDTTVVPDCLGSCGGLATVGFGAAGSWDPCQGDFYAQQNTCCLPGSCEALSWTCCLSAGGMFIPYQPCTECVVPVEGTNWGLLKSMYKAGRE